MFLLLFFLKIKMVLLLVFSVNWFLGFSDSYLRNEKSYKTLNEFN